MAAPPPRSALHGTGQNKTSLWVPGYRILRAKVQGFGGCRSALTPAARKSRRLVACVALESFRPSSSRISAMVVIDRLGQAEQLLQQPMDAGCPEQILAADHVSDALQRIVDHDGEMIAGRQLLSRHNDVSPSFCGAAVTWPVWPCGPEPVSVQRQRAGAAVHRPTASSIASRSANGSPVSRRRARSAALISRPRPG